MKDTEKTDFTKKTFHNHNYSKFIEDIIFKSNINFIHMSYMLT